MLNKEEFWLGVAFSAAFFWFQGPWFLLAAVCAGYCWARGGAKDQRKAWRRLGAPFFACLGIFMQSGGWITFIPVIPAFIVLSMGYGIPSTQPEDDGSWLGRFWYKILDGEAQNANMATRQTIAALLWLSFIQLAWVDLVAYILSGVILSVSTMLVVSRVEGTFEW